MKSPVGMEDIDPGSSPEDCYQLKKWIYGLCQAARQIWRKPFDTLKKEPFGLTVSPADPCMLFKENILGICIIIMYDDAMLGIGKMDQIQEFATMIQKEFSVKIQHILADYLGCEFHMNKEKTKGFVGTTIYNQNPSSTIWQKSHEMNAVIDTWNPKIHWKKIGE